MGLIILGRTKIILRYVKRVRNKIEYNETGIFKVNQVSERYIYQYFQEQTGPFVKSLYQSAYQICNVYTDKNTVLSAYQKLNGSEATNQVFLDHEDKYIPIELQQIIIEKTKFNDKFNCHGFTFLDAQFWLELDNKTLQTILIDDQYQACRLEDLDEHGISLYFDSKQQLIHSARKVNGHLLSKFGINHLMTKGEDDILNRYKLVDHKYTQYFNR